MRRYALAVLALCLALPVTAFAEEPHACCAKGGACDAAKGASGCETKACKAKACEGKACDSATCPSAGRAHAYGVQSACPIVPPSAGKTYAAPPVCPIAALLAEAGILEEEEERCCDQAKACSKCPCSGTTATSDAPCCEVSDYAVSACDDACEEEDDDCPNTETAARIQHLMQAAEHLAAAGLEEEADEIRRCAESLRGKLLEEKLAQLARLQAEIRQLQGAAAGHPQVKIHVEIVELSLTNLRCAGVRSAEP